MYLPIEHRPASIDISQFLTHSCDIAVCLIDNFMLLCYLLIICSLLVYWKNEQTSFYFLYAYNNMHLRLSIR